MDISMKSGYETTYNQVVHKLADCDLNEAALRLGFPPPEDGAVAVRFLGKDYYISPAGITPSDVNSSDPIARSVLVYYITSAGSGEPVFSYCLPGRFIQSSFAAGNLSWMFDSLVQKFGSSYKSICKPLNRLGAEFHGEGRPGEYTWTYSALPKIPVQIIYYEADDEFPCQIKLMLDEGAGRFLEFEQIAFLCGCLIKAIIRVDEKG